MSIKKSVLSILLTSLPWHPFSTEHLPTEIWKAAELKVSSCQHVSTSFYMFVFRCDFVPATKFSNKCQCCSQSSRNTAHKTNGEGKHNSFFYSYQSLQNSEVKGWWHSDLGNEHDIFTVTLSSLNVRTEYSSHNIISVLRGELVSHNSFIPVWLHLH